MKLGMRGYASLSHLTVLVFGPTFSIWYFFSFGNSNVLKVEVGNYFSFTVTSPSMFLIFCHKIRSVISCISTLLLVLTFTDEFKPYKTCQENKKAEISPAARHHFSILLAARKCWRPEENGKSCPSRYPFEVNKRGKAVSSQMNFY